MHSLTVLLEYTDHFQGILHIINLMTDWGIEQLGLGTQIYCSFALPVPTLANDIS